MAGDESYLTATYEVGTLPNARQIVDSLTVEKQDHMPTSHNFQLHARAVANQSGHTWRVSVEGDLDPESQGLMIGDITEGGFAPRSVVLRHFSTNELVGGIGSTGDLNTPILSLMGISEEALAQPVLVPDKPAAVRASAVVLDSSSASYILRIPPGGALDDYEDRFLMTGDAVIGADGNSYVPILFGPKVPIAQSEEFTDPGDYAFSQDQTVTILGGSTLVNSYTGETAHTTEVYCVNEGDRACDFVIQPRYNGANLGVGVTITLTNTFQLVTVTRSFATPPSAGDTVDVQVTSNNWQHNSRPQPWVRGTTEPTTIRVEQSGLNPGVT